MVDIKCSEQEPLRGKQSTGPMAHRHSSMCEGCRNPEVMLCGMWGWAGCHHS